MNIVWNRDTGIALINRQEFVITCNVRNECNGRRKLHDPDEVVNMVTAQGTWGHPYMPRPFPKGVWRITEIEETSDPVFAPVKIKTDAHQGVELWNLDADGGYDRATGIFDEDYGYHLHWSEGSLTTLGCGRVGAKNNKQVLILKRLVEAAWAKGEEVILTVD